MEGAISGLRSSLDKADYLITFSLITFTKKAILRFLKEEDTIYIALVTSLLTGLFNMQTVFTNLENTTQSLHKISSVLLVENVMNNVGSSTLTKTSAFIIVTHLVVTTATLLLIPSFVFVIQDQTVKSEILRLVFFMYAENSVLLTEDLEIDRVLPAVAIIILCILHHMSPKGIMKNVCKAISMLMMNVLVTIMIDSNGTAKDDSIQIAWLIGIIVVFENLEILIEELSELKDYAVWKVSTLFSQRLLFLGIQQDTIIFGSLFFLILTTFIQSFIKQQFQHSLKCNSVNSLILLVLINSMLHYFTQSMQEMPHNIVWMVLISILNVIHVVLKTVNHTTTTKKIKDV